MNNKAILFLENFIAMCLFNVLLYENNLISNQAFAKIGRQFCESTEGINQMKWHDLDFFLKILYRQAHVQSSKNSSFAHAEFSPGNFNPI